MKRLLLSMLLALIASHAVAENLAGLDVDRGYQRAGSDFTHYNTKNARRCAEDCSKDKQCRAFDYDTNARTCWLKDSVPPIRRNSEIVTGKKEGYDYNYGYEAEKGYETDKISAKTQGYCRLTNRENGVTSFDGYCSVKQTMTNKKTVFVIVLNDGTKFRFVQTESGWQIKMGNGQYTDSAKFVERGNHGVFKYDDFKLEVWAEGR